MFLSVQEATQLIERGTLAHIAGDDSVLKLLPKGNWIGGTTPYFITNEGGIMTKDKVFVNELNGIKESKIVVYNKNTITDIVNDTFPDGLTFLIMPFASEVSAIYAKKAPHIDNLLMMPIVGWISGYDLSSGGTAGVYNGVTGNCYYEQAVALHVRLPEERMASLGIVNIFEADDADEIIEFEADALDVTECIVGKEKVCFADYIAQNRIDTQMPLVANSNGIYINISIKDVDQDSKVVSFYAPVLSGEQYRFAKKVEDYEAGFRRRLTDLTKVKPIFSCNCILNYLYGKLEGKSTPPFEGPVTFGEVAYQLLNQTLVYVEY